MAAVATRSRPKVFLTSAATDGELAAHVASVLDASVVGVVRVGGPEPSSGGAESYLRNAIGRSAAVVVVVSRSTTAARMPASVLFEIGAATGAHKPVFVILEDPAYRLGFSVPDMHVLPISRVDEVGQALAELGG